LVWFGASKDVTFVIKPGKLRASSLLTKIVAADGRGGG